MLAWLAAIAGAGDRGDQQDAGRARRAHSRRSPSSGLAGFENGAGIVLPRAAPSSWPPPPCRSASLPPWHRALVAATGAPLRTIARPRRQRADGAHRPLRRCPRRRARARRATLPLLVDPRWDDELRRALPPRRAAVRLVRGNRFLHLQGNHDKADVVPRLLALAEHGAGAIVALGDAPERRSACSRPPTWRSSCRPRAGPHPELLRVASRPPRWRRCRTAAAGRAPCARSAGEA